MKEIVLAEILTILALADNSFPWFYESKSKRIKSENQSGPVWYRVIGLKIVSSQVDNWYPQLHKIIDILLAAQTFSACDKPLLYSALTIEYQ